MKHNNFSNRTRKFNNKEHYASFIFSSIKANLSALNEGWITLAQALYIIQWAHSVFKAMDNFAGLLFSEKYLLRLKAVKAQQENDITKLIQLVEGAHTLILKSKTQALYQPSHTKSLAFVYWQLGLTYYQTGNAEKGTVAFETAESLLFHLGKEYSPYPNSEKLLIQIQTSFQNLNPPSGN